VTPQQVEAIYKLNLQLGHSAALRAVYTQGYMAGAAIAPSTDSPDITPSLAAPAQMVKFKRGSTVL
jgi:hypothetical protein